MGRDLHERVVGSRESEQLEPDGTIPVVQFHREALLPALRMRGEGSECEPDAFDLPPTTSGFLSFDVNSLLCGPIQSVRLTAQPYARAGSKARSRRLFSTTLTELNAIAALAMIGDRSSPKKGYRSPAAIGIPSTL